MNINQQTSAINTAMKDKQKVSKALESNQAESFEIITKFMV